MAIETMAKAVERIYGNTSGKKTNEYTTSAKKACGFADTPTKKLTDKQRSEVIGWFLKDAMAKDKAEIGFDDVEPTPYANETIPEPTQPDSTSVQAQTLTNSRATTTKSTNKMKDKALRGVEAQLIHIRTPDNVRKAVWLEPVFCDALEKVTTERGENKDAWLTKVLVNVWGGANADTVKGKDKANLASAVRCSIVKELLS